MDRRRTKYRPNENENENDVFFPSSVQTKDQWNKNLPKHLFVFSFASKNWSVNVCICSTITIDEIDVK